MLQLMRARDDDQMRVNARAEILNDLGYFDAGDLPAAAGFAGFRRAAYDPSAPDCRFNHAPERLVARVPHAFVPGVVVFGDAEPAIAAVGADAMHRSAGISSVMLNHAVLAPQSMAVIDAAERVFVPSVDHRAVGSDDAARVGSGRGAAGGDLRLVCPAAGSYHLAELAVPVGGAGLPGHDRFFYNGLATALHHRLMLGPRATLVGRPLLGWQEEVLDAVGLRQNYAALEQPTRFRKLVASTMLSRTESCPNRFARALFDRLRFRLSNGARPVDAQRRLFVAQDQADNRHVLVNQAELETLAGGFGFEVVRPATMAIADQVRCFAGASCVIAASGASLEPVGFCDPGTRVLELRPDCLVDGWGRAACHVFGLRWHGLFAALLPSNEMAGEAAHEFRVKPAIFDAALRTVFGQK